MKHTPQSLVPCLIGIFLLGGCSRSQPVALTDTGPTPETSAHHEHIVSGDDLPETTDGSEHEEHGSEPHAAHHDHFEAEGALITNHGIALFQQTQRSGKFSPSQRAQIIARRLNEAAENQGLDPQRIVARSVNGLPTVYFLSPHGGGSVLATIDSQTATQFGFHSNAGALTMWWRDVLRDHAAIIAGNAPLWTTPYSSVLQKVYTLCQKQQTGVPTHESFEQAISKLTRAERDDLQGLYIRVPENYRPQN